MMIYLKTFQQKMFRLQVTMVMDMLLGSSICLLLLLSCLGGPVESRALHLDSCSVNVEGDREIGIRLLDKSLIKDVQEGQVCCFLHLVLRFYVERVFSNYASSQPQQQRCSSALANAFVSIRKDIHKCHCQCGEETRRKADSIHAEFIKLQASEAAQKAMGELDTVLDWLEGLSQKTHL
ncbi:putative interleukin-20-like [Scophthalmus maximus]|uniref:Interleukin family protein n=1 Tax=Scophthalmus maximus TaxID=52904 RepID=A0A2U9BGH7_SCOMX|nr:putative interleukin-20-like [Scophthalmus maximus]